MEHKCLVVCHGPRENGRRPIQVTLNPDVVKLFDKTMKERGEDNRSEMVEYLMICWIYRDPDTGECSKDCPQYEENEEKPDVKES
jgi:hypothetical protein